MEMVFLLHVLGAITMMHYGYRAYVQREWRDGREARTVGAGCFACSVLLSYLGERYTLSCTIDGPTRAQTDFT
jgi:hypothetical protein